MPFVQVKQYAENAMGFKKQKLLSNCEKCKLEGTTQLDRTKLPLTVSHAGDKAYLFSHKGDILMII